MREIKEDFSPLQPEDGKISHVHGLVESTLWKWPYYEKQSTCSTQSISKFLWQSAQKWKNQSWNTYGNTKDLK
jgi:hypothetical protein